MESLEKEEAKDKALAEQVEVLERIAETISPSEKYQTGELKVDHEFTLPEGSIVRSREDKEGFVQIVLEKPDGSLVDFSDFLPPDWRFVSPTWCLRKEGLKRMAGMWFSHEENKIVSVGEIKNPESILALLHEIGHTKRPLDAEYKKAMFKDFGRSEPFHHKRSSRERNAWADAIKIMRTLREEGVDFFELFSWDKIKTLMFATLAYHRLCIKLEKELEMTKKDPEFGEKDLAYLEKLFDGGKFERLIKRRDRDPLINSE